MFEVEANHMVIVRDIEIYSICEHHLLPFFGTCHIGYIPRGKVVGVSKLARLADLFARRLQVQERLTNQIARTLMDALQPEGVGVIIEAQHLCMMMRGVEKQGSRMVTSAMFGGFHDSVPRATSSCTCPAIVPLNNHAVLLAAIAGSFPDPPRPRGMFAAGPVTLGGAEILPRSSGHRGAGRRRGLHTDSAPCRRSF